MYGSDGWNFALHWKSGIGCVFAFLSPRTGPVLLYFLSSECCTHFPPDLTSSAWVETLLAVVTVCQYAHTVRVQSNDLNEFPLPLCDHDCTNFLGNSG